MSNDYVNVIHTNPGSDTSGFSPSTVSTPGLCLVWAKTGTFTNTTTSGVQTNYICQTSQTLSLDGYDSTGIQSNGCYLFKGCINFTLLNPIYTDDENDLCLMYIVFPTTTGQTYNFNQSFNVKCSMYNLGTGASSPIYQVTSTSSTGNALPSIVIPINKWFAFRSPGSIYQLCIEGYTNTICSPPNQTANTCLCNTPT